MSALELPTPTDFPAFPFNPPYSIQVDLMRHLYESIERKKIAIVESPTGTGKTLSLLCASFTWLNDEKQRARKGKLDSLAGSNEDVDWVVAQTRERHRRELETDEREYEERLIKARKREAELRKKMTARVTKRPKRTEETTTDEDEDESVYLPDDSTEDDDNFSPAVRALMAQLNKTSRHGAHEEQEPTCTKIYYASRTHSQLSQILPELRRLKTFDIPSCSSPVPADASSSSKKRAVTEIDDDDGPISYFRTVPLGSRKQLCIHDDLRSKSRDLDESCRELLAEKGDKRCPHLPSVDEETRLLDFRDQILASPKDIEDLAQTGRASNVCPYFGSRRAIPQAELVTLPYNLLLQKSAREALGIDLTGQVVIVDEAHNLIPTLLSLSTTRLTLATLTTSFTQVCIYVSKFRNRLSPIHLLHLKRLVVFLDALKKFMTKWKEDPARQSQKTELMTVAELIVKLGSKVVSLNLLEIEKYLRTSKVARKISGYSDKQAGKENEKKGEKRATVNRGAVPPLHTVEEFMLSLTGSNEDGRVTLSVERGDSEIKYQLLNPAPHFIDVIESARSVILAGGTMSPISDIVHQLFSTAPVDRITSFSCGHIVPKSNLLTMAVTKGPRGGELQYKAGQQSDPNVISELGQIILNFTNLVPNGMIVFFPSYSFLNKVKDAWKATGMLDKYASKKKVFFEPEDSTQVESTLQEYSAAAKNSAIPKTKGGALLFAVIGAKLSEGLNFADDLARAVIIVGLPFANLGSPELRERLKYVKQLEEERAVKRSPGQKDAAAELYENMCMNAVNQSIGRAIRHRADWAALILLDKRYSTNSIKNKLPKWIGGEMKVTEGFGQVVKEMGSFYRDKRIP